MERYDPLIDILKIAEESVSHPAKAAVLRNLQTALREDAELSKELGRRVAAIVPNENSVQPTSLAIPRVEPQSRRRLRPRRMKSAVVWTCQGAESGH